MHGVDERVQVGIDVAVLAVADHGGEFGRRESDDGHADRHRLDDRQAEARPADRVEEEAVRAVNAARSRLPISPMPPADCASMPTRSSGTRLRDIGEDIAAEPPAALPQMIHDDDAALLSPL